MVWYGLVWFGVVWYGPVWFFSGLFCFYMVWCGIVWFGLLCYGLIWFGIAGMVCYGLVWFDLEFSYILIIPGELLKKLQRRRQFCRNLSPSETPVL